MKQIGPWRSAIAYCVQYHVIFKGLQKASGPDCISALLLKTFAAELTPAWSPLFQLSFYKHTIPKDWKKAIIIPFPKKPCPKDKNDFRTRMTSDLLL